ncbi:MAG: trypsin-like peptidase domain-containing protein [Candidatus Nitrosopolaris sp.]
MHHAFMAGKARKLSLLIIFIAIFFIQTAASSKSIYVIAQQQNSSIFNTNNTNSLLLNEENTLNKLFKQTEDSVVTIIRTLPSSTTVTTPETQNTTVLESGFLYDNQGHIITTKHAIDDTKIVNVLFENGNRRTAKVIGSDPLDDIAVLKIVENSSQLTQQQKIPPLPGPLIIGNSSKLKIGQPVIAIGNPYGLERTMTAGIVSQTGRLVPVTSSVEKFLGLHFPWSVYSIPDAIQTDAPINRGNGGGPLLNLQGQVIGMNTATIGNAIGFAISSNTISRIVPVLVAKGNYIHPYLGLALETSPSAIAEDYESVPAHLKGVFVNVIQKGGPADRAGILGSNIDQYYKRHTGDMIVAIDGHNTTKAEDFMSYIEGHKNPGDSVNLTIYRDGKMLNLIANLKPWPAPAPYIRQATSASNPE